MTGAGGEDPEGSEAPRPERATGQPPAAPDRPDKPPLPDALADVLASIRTLVSAEAAARINPQTDADGVLMLTPAMRVDTRDDGPEIVDNDDGAPGRVLAAGIGGSRRNQATGEPAPIFDEESLRAVINAIVREELQGELGDRIARNLRKLIRREIADMREEMREP